ncbi:hypothetical protein [Oscillatoria sp. FACHB-1406]|uniref:hypothetical protein n=1 Tax=Oscillatoria sp. FACHB-1406 TaxID=2692846 RepID=UPI0016895FF6|nr:hypothetical protein [Oscillatoria sp. FACHB-1406]MBD2578242.1 hypothetical protein [Oscillatoria sp. FACHB-1406]
MFVRWEQRKENLEAVLVEADSQARQRVVKTLACIKNEDVHTYWGHLNFWKDVSSVLEDFPDETREQIVGELSGRIVPVPNWAVERMEALFNEYHQRGESLLEAIEAEKQRHEMKLIELTLQEKGEREELEAKKATLLEEIASELGRNDE